MTIIRNKFFWFFTLWMIFMPSSLEDAMEALIFNHRS